MKASFVATTSLAFLSAADAFCATGLSPARSTSSTKQWAHPDPQLVGSSPASDYGSLVATSEGEVAIMPWNDVKQWDTRPAPLSAGLSVASKGSMVQGVKPLGTRDTGAGSSITIATKTANPPASVSRVPAGFKDIGIAEGQKFEVRVPSELANSNNKKPRPPPVSENWFSHYPGDQVDAASVSFSGMDPFCIPLVEGVQAH